MGEPLNEPTLAEALAVRLSSYGKQGYPSKALRTAQERATRVIEREAAACIERLSDGLCATCWGDGFHRVSDAILGGACHACGGTGQKAAPRDPTKLPARDLTDAELIAEQTRVEKIWDEMHEPDEDGEIFAGHGGSPGEWMVERMDEIATEQARRAAAA